MEAKMKLAMGARMNLSNGVGNLWEGTGKYLCWIWIEIWYETKEDLE